jgi:endoglucanase
MMLQKILLLVLASWGGVAYTQEATGALIKSDFETDVGGWELVLTGKSEAESQLKDGADCVTILNGGRDIFGVQLQHAGFGLVEGETYQLSFEARASSERAVKIKVGQAVSPFAEVWSQDLTLQGEMQTLSYTFIMSKPNEDNAKVTLFMGGVTDAPLELCFDTITLAEGNLTIGENLLKNGDFAADAQDWQLGAEAFEAEGNVTAGEYCVSLRNSGENPWDVALRQDGLILESGKKYTLSFDAYADNAVVLGVKLGQTVEPYTEYFFKDQKVTSEKTTYTFSPDLTSSDPNGQLELFMGGANIQTFPTQLCLDNFLLQEIALDAAERQIPYIMIDQFGYRPDDTKVAVLVDPQVGFNAADSYEPSGTLEVRRAADDSVVFSGDTTVWNEGAIQENSGDKGWWFDFSRVNEPGSYYLVDPANEMRSYDFDINQDVYKNVLMAALRMFYYNRANIAKEEPYADARWTDGESYVGKGQDTEAHFVEDKTNDALVKDLSGGWFDAGDVNKYVTFAESPVHVLLTAFEENPHAFSDDFTIPESGNGLPDVLDEIKWETDWLQKMQDEDGGVIIKMGDIDYSTASPPSTDTGARFYGPVCSASSIAAAGMFAHAALVFAEFPDLADYASNLQERAVRAYDWYETNPKRDDCDTGEIKAGDADRTLEEQEGIKVTAAVYLYALTGEESYHQAIKNTYQLSRPFHDGETPRWSMYTPEQGDALLYYTRLDTADAALAKIILGAKVAQAKGVSKDIYGFQEEQDLYRAYMRDESLHWGSNSVRAALGSTNFDFLHYDLDVENIASYTEKAQGILHYFHGVNPFNMVYLTNMAEYGAEYSANEIYHTWFAEGSIWDNALTSERGPAPGYVPGGPNASYTGELSPPVGEPAQKAYKDWNGTSGFPWEITEPAIYYQAAYVRLLANFVNQ